MTPEFFLGVWYYVQTPLILVCSVLGLYCAQLLWRFPQIKKPDAAKRSRNMQLASGIVMFVMWMKMSFNADASAQWCATVPAEGVLWHTVLAVAMLMMVGVMLDHAKGYREEVMKLK